MKNCFQSEGGTSERYFFLNINSVSGLKKNSIHQLKISLVKDTQKTKISWMKDIQKTKNIFGERYTEK